MIARTSPLHRILRKVGGGVILIVAILTFAPQVSTQQQDLDALAADTAAAITPNVKYMMGAARVLVPNFIALHQEPGDLGSKLADQFADALRKQADGFAVIDRKDYFEKSGEDGLPTGSYEDPDTVACYLAELRADTFVEGLYDTGSDNSVSLWVRVFKDKKIIFDKRTKLPLTPELQGAVSKPAPRMNESPGPVVWISPDRPPKDIGNVIRVADGSDNGYTSPMCLYCPSPAYSDAASKEKVQGTVTLDIEIDRDGFPVEIAVIDGLPCGLTRKAIDAVAQWKFKPALGPDGKPIAVVQRATVTFHLY
jgi:TonB family protein